MYQPLIIIAPPGSFSSVVSTMIGQHPQLYDFPELWLFNFATVGEVIDSLKGKNSGLIRLIAQEHYGMQTKENNWHALKWLKERSHWSTKKVFDYLLDLINPKIGVEKTPATCQKIRFLENSYQFFPQAYYLHLTRHPLPSAKSIEELTYNRRKISKQERLIKSSLDGLLTWFYFHRNILQFTQTLPVGQTMRIKAESLLSEPDLYLPQIAQWLGLQTDLKAVEAMKHPENSPYAYVGSSLARGGNDLKFMRNPQLSPGTIPEPSLQTFWSENLLPPAGEINQLAHTLGYQ